MISRNTLYKYFAPEIFLKYMRAYRYRNNILSLMYHEVLDDDDDINAWTVVKRSQFIEQMKYLKKNFELVSLDDAVEIASSNKDYRNKYAVITFDDGYKGNKEVVFPVVKEMGIPISIFVATEAIVENKVYWYDKIIVALNNYKSLTVDLKKYNLKKYQVDSNVPDTKWCQIQDVLEALKTLPIKTRKNAVSEIIDKYPYDTKTNNKLAPLSITDIEEMSMSPFVIFGAHSHCHNILTQLEYNQTLLSIEESKKYLEKWTNKPVNHFAYPNGNYDAKTIQALKETEFVSSQTVNTDLWGKSQSLFEIPRVSVGRFDSLAYFKAKVCA